MMIFTPASLSFLVVSTLFFGILFMYQLRTAKNHDIIHKQWTTEWMEMYQRKVESSSLIDKVKRRMEQASVETMPKSLFTPLQKNPSWLIAWTSVGTIAFVLFTTFGYVLFHLKIILFIGALGGAVAWLPFMQIDSEATKRKKNIQAKLEDFILFFVTLQDAGMTVRDALLETANAFPSAIGEEFKKVATQSQWNGGDWGQSLRTIAEKMDIRELDELANSFIIAMENGGELNVTLHEQAKRVHANREYELGKQKTSKKVALNFIGFVFSIIPLIGVPVIAFLMSLLNKLTG